MQAIVNDGINLIKAAASREEKVVISSVIASSRFEHTLSELVSKPRGWYNAGTGTVSGVVAGSGEMEVKVSFDADAYNSAIKSVAIFAKIEDDDSPFAEKLLFVWSNGNSAITREAASTLIFTIPMNVPTSVIENVGSIVDADIQAAIDASESDAKAYADEKDADTLVSAQGYADEKDSALETTVKGYADDEIVALSNTIAGEYISNVSFDESTSTFTFSSADETKVITIVIS